MTRNKVAYSRLYYTHTGVAIGCNMMHIFCCIVPIMLNIMGISSNLWAANFLVQTIEEFETYLLLFSGLILMISFVMMNYQEKYQCCSKDSECVFDVILQNKLFAVFAILYLINLLMFFWHG